MRKNSVIDCSGGEHRNKPAKNKAISNAKTRKRRPCSFSTFLHLQGGTKAGGVEFRFQQAQVFALRLFSAHGQSAGVGRGEAWGQTSASDGSACRRDNPPPRHGQCGARLSPRKAPKRDVRDGQAGEFEQSPDANQRCAPPLHRGRQRADATLQDSAPETPWRQNKPAQDQDRGWQQRR